MVVQQPLAAFGASVTWEEPPSKPSATETPAIPIPAEKPVQEKSEEFANYDAMRDRVSEGDVIHWESGAGRTMTGTVKGFNDDERTVDVDIHDESIPGWSPAGKVATVLPDRFSATVPWKRLMTKAPQVIQGESGAVTVKGNLPAVTWEEPETKYKFGSTQANIPEGEANKAIETARAKISDSDLAGNGKEIGAGGNHVTVKYGIQGEDTAGIRKFLEQQTPFEATLGKTEKFEPNDHTEGAAVIIAPIQSPELTRMNQELEKHGDFQKSDFEYKPHATVAYVKPEVADRYVGMDVTHGKKFRVDSIAITNKSGEQEIVKLDV